MNNPTGTTPMILEIINKFRRRQIISSIRENMNFFGHDLSNMSDDEIEKGVARAGKAFSRVGYSAKQAAEALNIMACAGNSLNLKEYNARRMEETQDRF